MGLLDNLTALPAMGSQLLGSSQAFVGLDYVFLQESLLRLQWVTPWIGI